jgi:hypothetical protein
MVSMMNEDFRNIIRIHEHEGWVYLEIEAQHDGHKVFSTVKVERGVFKYHLVASGLLA